MARLGLGALCSRCQSFRHRKKAHVHVMLILARYEHEHIPQINKESAEGNSSAKAFSEYFFFFTVVQGKVAGRRSRITGSRSHHEPGHVRIIHIRCTEQLGKSLWTSFPFSSFLVPFLVPQFFRHTESESITLPHPPGTSHLTIKLEF